MELFTVNRYNEEKLGPKVEENEILQKLLQKAEKRKRKHKLSEKKEEEQLEVTPAAPLNKDEEPLPEAEPQHETEPSPALEEQFQVLGSNLNPAKRPKVEMILPNWLAHPTLIEGQLIKEDSEVDPTLDNFLEPYTRQALKQMKIKQLFPVQRQVIPWILEAHAKPEPFRPRDLCVSAPTGSGKTLAFAIPIVQLLSQRVECKVRALVVLPVAELALQVFKVISALCQKTDLEVCLLSKQHRLEDEQEKLVELYKGKFYSKVDIVVSTPGRLVEHLHATKGFCLKSLKFLIIDEADRIMDAVFQNWLYHLDSHVKETTDKLLAGGQTPLCYAELLSSFGRQPHKLLFSATLSQDPEKLQNLRLFQPKLFTTVMNLPSLTPLDSEDAPTQTNQNQFVGKYTTPAELTEKYCFTDMRLKPLTLFTLVEEHKWKRFLCFTNSADTANRLAYVLGLLFKNTSTKIAELSSKLSALARSNTLADFGRGKINGLICSDALARGIDVPDVDLVLSYEAARHIKTYIHRVGRTARAGKPGLAITLLTDKDQDVFQKMLREVGKSLGEELTVSPDMEVQHADIYKSALNALRIRQEKQKSHKIFNKVKVARQANLHKPQPDRPLTLMEKLQQKAINPLAATEKKETLPKLPKQTKKQQLAKKRKAIEE